MNKRVSQGAMLLGCALLLMTGCEWKVPAMSASTHPSSAGQTDEHAAHGSEPAKAAPMEDVAAEDKSASSGIEKSIEIINSKGSKIGTAKLLQTPQGVKISVDVAGLTPGKHGIHIHQTGVCQAPDFKTAGEHLNPEGKKHGFDNPEGPHAGDLPNLEVGSDGRGKAEFVDAKVTLEKDKANSLLKPGGTSLVIHEAADDYKTDPAGNSGNRIACGVIM
ncbi:superoxide dismutase family protein [Paenibacillus sp. TAB 01]|uniref:superoxide dismutase family protein n=1 Tax=Paenibacillus sp. TAB 01 TaxID=3368988 RepID=UPI0037501165